MIATVVLVADVARVESPLDNAVTYHFQALLCLPTVHLGFSARIALLFFLPDRFTNLFRH